MNGIRQTLVVVLCCMAALAGCGPGMELRDPTEPFREIGGAIKRSAEGALDLKDVALVAPLQEIRAEDGSFALSTEPTASVPFYSNEKGPFQLRFLRSDGWRSKYAKSRAVRVILEGGGEQLYGRLAIFPAANVAEEHRVEKRFHARITITDQALAQMEKEGVGLSCEAYRYVLQDWCDWALWISKTPIED